MARRSLKDGESRKIRKKFWDLPFDVVAHRGDSETPYVLLQDGRRTVWLTDVAAIELIHRLGKALEILPTSK